MHCAYILQLHNFNHIAAKNFLRHSIPSRLHPQRGRFILLHVAGLDSRESDKWSRLDKEITSIITDHVTGHIICPHGTRTHWHGPFVSEVCQSGSRTSQSNTSTWELGNTIENYVMHDAVTFSSFII